MLGLIIIGAVVATNIYLARKKNRSVFVWIVLSIVLNFISTIVLLIIKARVKTKPNRAPLVACIMLMPFLWIFAENKFYSLRQADKVIQALEAYKKDSAVYPETLEELVPKYLSSIPNPKMGKGQNNKFYYDRGFEFSLESRRGKIESDNPQKYRITYFIFFAMRATYIPSQHKWVIWD